MAEPFHAKHLAAPSTLEQLLGRTPRRNGLTAINNLLAAARSVEEVSARDAEEAAASYGLRLGARAHPERLAMVSEFLDYCLTDRRLDAAELAQLHHLRRILRLRESDLAEIHDRAVRAVYSRSVDEVLEDNHLDDVERQLLERIAKDLGLPRQEADRIYATKAQEIVQGAIEIAIEDERLSPEEDAELASLAQNLGVELTSDDETRRTLERFRTYWQLEECALPEVPVDIPLQNSEHCYLKLDAQWLERHKVTRRFGYYAPTVRLKIVEGVYWRAGNMACAPTTEDVMEQIDSGTCYVTNRRLLFHGKGGRRAIPLGHIVGVEPYGNGVEVEREHGRGPFLQFEHGTDIFGLVLDRVIDERACV